MPGSSVERMSYMGQPGYKRPTALVLPLSGPAALHSPSRCQALPVRVGAASNGQPPGRRLDASGGGSPCAPVKTPSGMASSWAGGPNSAARPAAMTSTLSAMQAWNHGLLMNGVGALVLARLLCCGPGEVACYHPPVACWHPPRAPGTLPPSRAPGTQDCPCASAWQAKAMAGQSHCSLKGGAKVPASLRWASAGGGLPASMMVCSRWAMAITVQPLNSSRT